MQTIASLAERLGAEVDSLVGAMHKLGHADAGPDSPLSGEECDTLIEFDDDPGVVDRILAERHKREEMERKRREKATENLRKATEKKKAETAKKKAAATKKSSAAAKKAATNKKSTAPEVVEEAPVPPVEIEILPAEESAEILPAETPEIVATAEPVAAPETPGTAEATSTAEPAQEVTPEPTPEPTAEPQVATEAEAQPLSETTPAPPTTGAAAPTSPEYAEILPPLDVEENSEVDPDKPAAYKGPALGPLAEAERRAHEEEERRKARLLRPLPNPDPDVVAEVIRRNNERNLERTRAKQPGGGRGGAQNLQVSHFEGLRSRPGGPPGQRGPGGPGGGPAGPGQRGPAGGARGPVANNNVMGPPPTDEDGNVRRGGPGSQTKSAKKKQKKAEKARARVLEETKRRDAAAMVREYTAGGLTGGGPRRKKRKMIKRDDGVEVESEVEGGVIEIEDTVTVEKLADLMGLGVSDIILELMDENIFATKNQILDMEMIRKIAERHNFEVQTVIPEEETILAEEPDDPADMVLRAPVITVMGHVDHGKTSFLDAVRTAKVAEGEAGGITQHIAAYDVTLPTGRVVFLDTPGHEAFTSMRARGSQVTDVVVLVVAADDGVRPQTIEAIDHAKAAGVPIVVAINKIDKPGATPERVRQELTQYELLDEAWGGKTIMRNISARDRTGVDELLEMLALESQMLELKANPKKRARGTVIESEISRGYGAVAWVLVQNGTLRVGDVFLCGETYGRVRVMQDSHGKSIQEAAPSTPVLVTGFSTTSEAGDKFVVVEEERVARAVAEKRANLNKLKRGGTAAKRMSLEDFHEHMLAGTQKTLNMIIKADVQGSVDVLNTSFAKIGNDEVTAAIVHSGVGGINESDVMLASASNAVIFGFHVTASAKIQKLAETEGVEIRTYRVIYEAMEDVRKALEGMLTPESKETVTGHAEIRQVFSSSAIGNIAGCSVTDGEIDRNAQCRLIRDGKVVFDNSKISTLRRGKDDAKSVATGFECGIKIDRFEDIKVGDIIETFKVEAVGRKLA